MRQLLRRAWYLICQRRFEAELADEMEFHRAMKQRELEETGLAPLNAAYAAHRALGSMALAQDHSRDMWISPWLDALARDIRFGVRQLRKNPGFSVIVVVTLAVAIGANTAVFTLVDHALMRPLPYPDPERLATVVRHYGRGGATSGEG